MKLILLWLRKYNLAFILLRYSFTIVALIALAMWLLKIPIKVNNKEYEWEPFFTILTAIGLGFNQFYRWLLTEATYSPAHTLAYGYVENFLEPTITQLKEQHIDNPLIYIYRAEDIIDLTKSNIDRVKADLANKGYILKEIQLNLKYTRARDVLSIRGSQKEHAYFDFPNTITTLYNYIDYKTSSQGELPRPPMHKISKKLLNEFYDQVLSLMKDKKLGSYILLCNDISNIS